MEMSKASWNGTNIDFLILYLHCTDRQKNIGHVVQVKSKIANRPSEPIWILHSEVKLAGNCETGRELGVRTAKLQNFLGSCLEKAGWTIPLAATNSKSRSGDQQCFLWKPEVDHKALNKDILKCQESCNWQQNVTWEKAHLDTKADGRWDNWALCDIAAQ